MSVALSATACGAAPEEAPTRAPGRLTRAELRERLVGCYALFDRSGRPASDSLYWAPAVAGLQSGGRAAKVSPAASTAKLGMGAAPSWRVDSLADTVRLRFHSGFSGTEFAFALRPGGGDTLRGRAVEHWDFGPPFETDAGRATAVRVACPAG